MTETQPFAPARRLQADPPARAGLRDLLFFERMLTGRVIHLVYWAGLCVISMVVFAALGLALGQALGGGLQGVLLAIPVLVIGLIAAGALALIWRSFCEFYVTIFRIGEDLRAMRLASEAGARAPGLG